MDFSLKQTNGIMDIDFIATDNKNFMIINAIFESMRLQPSLAKLQPIFQRGGALKNIVANETGNEGGSKLWFYIKTKASTDLITSLQTEVDSKLKKLVDAKKIDSYIIENLNTSSRSLFLNLTYKVFYETYQLKFTTSLDN